MGVNKTILKLLALVFAILFVFGLLIAFLTGNLGGGKQSKSGIAVIEINGEISGGESGSTYFGNQIAGSETILRKIRQAEYDQGIKGMILRINSPGGSAPASEEVYREVLRFKQRSGKPVIAVMDDMAASGGYFIAVSADEIFANPATMTGSIGVIMSFKNYHKLYEKYGIKVEAIKSGKYKDIGSSAREMTPEERELLQKMVNQIYGRFVDAVQAGRGLPRAQVLKLAQGQIYTGMEAQRLGLVDHLGNFYDAVEYIAKKTGARSTLGLVYYDPKPGFLERLLGGLVHSSFSIFGRATSSPLPMDILLLDESLLDYGVGNLQLKY